MLSSISTTNDETERLLGFSDAVFAIAMTFLALDLGAVPDDVGRPGGPTTVDFLHENIPDYVVYFGTFLVVGFLWWRHHLMFVHQAELRWNPLDQHFDARAGCDAAVPGVRY